MVNHVVNIQLVQQRITILYIVRMGLKKGDDGLTFETEAVKTTTSYSSPTRFIN